MVLINGRSIPGSPIDITKTHRYFVECRTCFKYRPVIEETDYCPFCGSAQITCREIKKKDPPVTPQTDELQTVQLPPAVAITQSIPAPYGTLWNIMPPQEPGWYWVWATRRIGRGVRKAQARPLHITTHGKQLRCSLPGMNFNQRIPVPIPGILWGPRIDEPGPPPV